MLKPFVLVALIVLSVAWFARNAHALVKLVMLGAPERRTGDWHKRIWNVVEQVFLHRRLMNRPGIGIAHALIFYGFLTVQICAFEIFGKGFVPTFDYSFTGPLYPVLMGAQDIMCVAVLAGLGFALYRRLFDPPDHLMLTADAYRIIALTTGVVGTILILGGAEIALGERDDVKWAMPVESVLASMMTGVGLGEHGLHVVKESMWWGHVLIVLFFMNYLAYSKHLHLLGAIPNIFFARTERRAALPTPNYEGDDIEIFGASEPRHFTWKHLLDTTACTECGRCTSVCPAQATGKPLSPMKIVHDLKLALFDLKPLVLAETPTQLAAAEAAVADVTPLIGGRTSHDELWACTTCGGCVNQCPVMIEHVDDIVEMRRNLVLMQADFPEELQRTFTALENEGNPWGVSAASRADWAEGTNVKVLDDGEETPLLFWVGCAGAIDSKAKKTTESVVKILNEAGVEFGVLGACESCTGDPARRAGNEYLYQMLAKQNIETLNSHKTTKVVTACPHCYNTLKNEYPDLGGNFDVVHHTELIDDLIADGKIKLQNGVKEKISFHDPCYLGRWNDKVKEPRKVLKALPGRELVEMERHGKDSFCCGAGGSRMWLEEHIGTPVNHERTREALETGADAIAVGCPFCNTMLTDGVKDKGAGDKVRVEDVAVLVAESMVAGAGAGSK